MNENKSHISKNEFVRSFFGRNQVTIICFRYYLTFIRLALHRYLLAQSYCSAIYCRNETLNNNKPTFDIILQKCLSENYEPAM